MIFSEAHRKFDKEPGLVEGDSGRSWTYGELRAEAEALAERLPAQRCLAFCFCRNDLASVVAYLACLRRGHPVVLLDASASGEIKERLVARYEPGLILEPASAGRPPWPEDRYRREEAAGGGALWRRTAGPPARLHPRLALLLTTSGTTGSPKLVRLSTEAVESNADSIARYLDLGPGERAVASLPIHYSYGLSILNSHLRSGGCVVLTESGVLRPGFWKTFSDRGCTSLAGVPYTYQMLARVGFEGFALPSLRTMTQAGGAMDPSLILKFDALMKRRGGRLFVMYGQTEAAPRIAYLPPERLPEKVGSVGIAVPGGELAVQRGGERLPRGETGEVVYRGPNVMLGYAESPEDLALGDALGGVLPTGDLGHFDADGFLYITGRLNRYSKVFGLRVNLDEIEQQVRARGPAAVTAGAEKIVVFCEYGDAQEHEDLRRQLAGLYKLNLSAFEFRRVAALPLKPSGKVDYSKLEL